MGEDEKKIRPIETTTKNLRKFVLEFLSSGHYTPGMSDANKLDLATRYIVVNAFLLVGMLIFIPMTVLLGMDPTLDISVILVDASFSILLVTLFFLNRHKVHIAVSSNILVYIFTLFNCYMLLEHPSGGVAGGALWSFLLPPLAYYVLGNLGIIPSVIVSAAMIYAFDVEISFYSYDFAFRTSIIFAFTIVFAGLSYKRMTSLANALMLSREQLRNELNEVEMMKDNIGAGIFLLDDKYEIQPWYSRFLPDILGKTTLDNVDFLACLANSLNKKDIDLLRDYFDMILKNQHDIETLRDINPLQEFTYKNDEGQEKILSIDFTQIERQNQQKVILCIARDVTSIKELERKLAAEEAFRQQEMKSLFEVMHVPPQSLAEFLDELDYEFERMNSILKDPGKKAEQIYRELYQGLHAMKSNALVVGLESPAKRFHEFEDKISAMIRDSAYSYENMLEVVFELERVMEIADTLRDILKKMESFSESARQMQSSTEILFQSIRNTISKGKAETNKRAVLKAGEVAWDSIDATYRRVLKDIIMQLTRNSLAHGIEEPTERARKGKTEEGIISLKIVNDIKSSKIHMEYADDGSGIDFEQVKRSAIEKNLIPDNADANNPSVLIKTLFSPGFSTAKGLSMQAGRGIGLSLVSDRIKEFKGSIKVKSAPNQGTKFIIELPYTF